MSSLKICRICLRTEAKMYNFNLYQLKLYYEEVMALKVRSLCNIFIIMTYPRAYGNFLNKLVTSDHNTWSLFGSFKKLDTFIFCNKYS